MYSKNSLSLEGEQVEIQRFIKQAEYTNGEEGISTDFSFHKFIPMPKGLSNEWEWCEDNWGVDCDIEAYYDAKRQTYCFDYDENLVSAIRGFLVVSRLFPQIKFTFEYYNHDLEDRDFALHGKTEFRDGIVISEEKGQVRIVCCTDCGRIESYTKEE